ncbi:MAG: methyltransferase domain-containing protein, partial [Planctomycetes bacterium]|nr:methyltransferase domain-containing protein [Planctomycetota bacterium]
MAKHYDSMMSHVAYERWVGVSTMIAELCPDENFKHLDVGCGTGSLVKLLREQGWRSYGGDLSYAMVSAARKDPPK